MSIVSEVYGNISPMAACSGVKIKWALWKKEDVMRVKADLMTYTESVEMLLAMIHMWIPLFYAMRSACEI